jgi:hypothetical protein
MTEKENQIAEAKRLLEKMPLDMAITVCEEVGSKLPNINETPPIHRKSERHYMQFWRYGVVSELKKLAHIKSDLESLKDKVLKEYENGNVVVYGPLGFTILDIDSLINQPIDGLLYDLNRNESTILLFIEDFKWINDFAMMKVLQKIKKDSYTIDDIERAVNHWSMTTVEKENIIKFLEK